MHPLVGLAVVLGDEAARVRAIELHLVSTLRKGVAEQPSQLSIARCAEPIANHEVGSRAAALAHGGRRHRMAVNQHGDAKTSLGLRDQLRKDAVKRLIETLD